MARPPINLDKTLGAVFIGNIVAAVLFGFTSVQMYIFFKGNTRDRSLFKYLMAFLWFLDLAHIVFMTHGVYFYLISNFGNFRAMASPTWSLLMQVVITSISDFIVRCIFARRIWILSGHSNSLLIFIVLSSAIVSSMGIAYTARGFIDRSYARLILESWLLYASLGGCVIADGIVTVSLCMLLDHSRTGIKSADSLVNTLMLYSINTGLLTSLCATASFVTFAIWPHEFVFIGFYFALGKLYVNSLLAVLNTRENLRKRTAGMATIPQSPESIQPSKMNFMRTTSILPSPSEIEAPSINKPQNTKFAWSKKPKA